MARKRIGWTTIKVPIPLADELRELAERKNLAMWQLLNEMMAFYKERSKKYSKVDEVDIDKIAYYIMKISKSVAWLQREPTKENLEKLIQTAEQIKQRLGVNTSMLIKAAETFVRTEAKEEYVNLNMALKTVIISLISLICG